MKIAQYPTCVSDFQWHIVSGLLPAARRVGRPRTCMRRVTNAIFYVLKSGCPWRMLPKDFPAWQTVYHHFRSWARSGLLEAINSYLRTELRRLEGKRAKPTAGIIDSQSVRSSAHGGAVGYDAGKKIKGRKRFVCVDTLGLLLGVSVQTADTPERSGAKVLMRPVLGSHRIKKIWADAGFSGPEFAGWVKRQRPRAAVEIIRRIAARPGFQVLPKRWVVERTFAWITHHRRLVRDYERSTLHASAWIFLAMIRVMLNQYS